MPAPALQIDVWFDLICPWCLIGHHQLQAALAGWQQARTDVPVRVRWHSVQLVPNVPAQGWPFQAFYEQRLGGAAAVAARQAQVQEAAQAAGARVDFARIQRMPNTASAHALLALAAQRQPADPFERLLRALFEAYFEQGQDIGLPSTLVALGVQHGLGPSDISDAIDRAPTLPAEDVPGVPFFVFNQRLGLSGAQPPAALLDAMRGAVANAVETQTKPHEHHPHARHA